MFQYVAVRFIHPGESLDINNRHISNKASQKNEVIISSKGKKNFV